MDDVTQVRATGLEDDDNFLELVRQRAGLSSSADALRLTCEVILYVIRPLIFDNAREFLACLPKSVEDFVFPRMEGGSLAQLSLSDLEGELERGWHVEQEEAARMAGAVGLSVTERIPIGMLAAFVKSLPNDLSALFPRREFVASVA